MVVVARATAVVGLAGAAAREAAREAVEAEARARVVGETATAAASKAVATGATEEREVGWRVAAARGSEVATAVDGPEAAEATALAGEAPAVASWVGWECPSTALAARRRW